MRDAILLGKGRFLLPVPGFVWRKQVAENGANGANHLRFMSPDHHRVRNFVVRELPRTTAALSPVFIAASLDLPIEKVTVILVELEKHLTFLYRDTNGAVAWAYPVTVEPTPHRGTYMNLDQCIYSTPIIQGALFGFKQGDQS